MINMLKEIKAAASYWSDHLYEFVPLDQIQQFKKQLENELNERYASHWYEEDPVRGSAYRAIIADYVQTDPILVKCAKSVGIDMVCFNVSLPREVVCWVNPGSVTVRKVVNQKHISDEIIYRRNPVSSPMKGVSPPSTTTSTAVTTTGPTALSSSSSSSSSPTVMSNGNRTPTRSTVTV